MNETNPMEGEEKVNIQARITDHNALQEISARYGMSPQNYQDVIRDTIMPQGASRAHFQAFIVVANTYNLNPLTQEIYAITKRGGGIQPIVGVNGWVTLINRQPEYDGMDFEYEWQDDKFLRSVTCKIWRKDRSRPTVVTEYMSECRR